MLCHLLASMDSLVAALPLLPTLPLRLAMPSASLDLSLMAPLEYAPLFCLACVFLSIALLDDGLAWSGLIHCVRACQRMDGPGQGLWTVFWPLRER